MINRQLKQRMSTLSTKPSAAKPRSSDDPPQERNVPVIIIKARSSRSAHGAANLSLP